MQFIHWNSKYQIGIYQPISGHCFHFIPPENTKKPKTLVFLRRCKMGIFAKNGLTLPINKF